MSKPLESFSTIKNDDSNESIAVSNSLSSSFDIIAENLVRVNEKFILEYNLEASVNRKTSRSCKILKFSSKLDLERVLRSIDELDPNEYMSLFIFIIDIRSIGLKKIHGACGGDKNYDLNETVQKIKKKLVTFGKSRPLVLQLSSEEECIRTFYYKEDDMDELCSINMKCSDFEKYLNFPTFLCFYLTKNIDKFENIFFKNFPKIEHSTLILRFLRILDFRVEYVERLLDALVLKCAKFGSINDFSAIIDATIQDKKQLLCEDSEKYFGCILEDKKICTSNQISDPSQGTSVLLTAVESNNKDIVEHLRNDWSNCILHLPFDHKVRISTTAFKSKKFDILSDLLNPDFPFPEDINKKPLTHEVLKKIVDDRQEFENAIINEDLEKLEQFREKYECKIGYNIENVSALKRSLLLGKYHAYFYFKSCDFLDFSFEKPEQVLNNQQMEKFRKFLNDQRLQNKTNAIPDANSSILLLCQRSKIHKRSYNEELEPKYRENIRKWFEDINKIESGSELLNVVATCENLKIIFDFNNNTVDDMNLAYNKSQGIMYGNAKCIFIGAKFLGEKGEEIKERGQVIKGIIAHELCHYAMRLVYENLEYPFYGNKEEAKNAFKQIVKAVDKWSSKNSSRPLNDGFNGIISTVFTLYDAKDIEPELIVRIVQILATFDDEPDKIKYLKEEYEKLYNFWTKNVVPELKKFPKKNRESIRKFNKRSDVLPEIINRKIQISTEKNMNINAFIYHKNVIVCSNVPKLFLSNIYNYMRQDFADLFDTFNIFVDSSKINPNSENLKDLKSILLKNSNLNVFIDCSVNQNDIPKHFIEIAKNDEFMESNFFFIVSNKNQQDDLKEKLDECKFQPKLETTDYSWNDLSADTQKSLSETNIIFQNNLKTSIMQLFKEDTNQQRQSSESLIKEQEYKFLRSLSDVIDGQLLNHLMEKKQITVNVQEENLNDKENFDILYQKRDFIKKQKESKREQKIQHEDLLAESKNKHYVLISDSAGTGKSWVMKNLKNTFLTPDQLKWVTYVDLKQFVDEFKAQESNPDFPTFMAGEILKLIDSDSNDNFEAKFFKRFYKIGRVITLFDGFDEIAPDCAEVVSELAQSFNSNGGNQLWIATRDYFEVDLQSKLHLDVVYGLDEFTTEYGEELIATSWIIRDLEKLKVPKGQLIGKVHEKKLKSKEYKTYKITAQKIVNKVKMLESRTIGLPQLFKMIVDLDKNELTNVNFNGYIVYENFGLKLNDMWKQDKGKIKRKQESQTAIYKLKFFECHQLSAIASYFPDREKICGIICDNKEWPVASIIACSIMTKRGGKYLFLHETFREFFAARFVVEHLNETTIHEDFYEIFVIILTRREFTIVRMFLNDAITNSSTLSAILPKILNFLQKFYEMESFGEFFSKGLKNLTSFVITVLGKGNYEDVKKVLFKASQEIVTKSTSVEIFKQFQEFIFEFLKIDDLKNLVLKQEMFQGLVQSSLKIEVFEDFVSTVNNKTNSEFVKNGLKLMSDENLNGNIFDRLCWSADLSSIKVQNCLRIIRSFLNDREISELIKTCNKYGQNILHVVIRTGNEDKLSILWTAIEENFETKDFKELATNEAAFGRNIFHYAAYSDEIDFHKTFWTLLMKTFTDKQELKRILITADELNDNFTFYLIESKQSAEIMELAFNKLKEKFTEDEFKEILKSKDRNGRNLLQIAAVRSTDIKTHQVLWKTFEDSFNNDDELPIILNHVDNDGCNLMFSVLRSPSIEIYEFTVKKVELALQHEDNMKVLLRMMDTKHQNILQSSAMVNESKELHLKLWDILQKYFDQTELSTMVKNIDLLFVAIRYNTREIIELMWTKIKTCLSKNDQAEFLQSSESGGKNLLNAIADRWTRPEIRECIQNILQECGL